MNFVDLFRCQHGPEFGARTNAIGLFFSSIRRSRGPVTKLLEDKDLRGSQVVLVFLSRLATLGPTIQTSAAERFRSKAKLFFCSFQAAGCGAFGPAIAGVRDSVRPLPDVARGSAEDSRDEPRATSSDCRGRSAIFRIRFELPRR